MMKYLLASLLFFTFTFAQEVNLSEVNLNRHQFSLGTQVYSLTRSRKGGTHQEAVLGGFIGEYNRLKRYGWYWGLQGAWGWAKLDGHSGNCDTLRSNFTDAWAEGRWGYTLQQKDGRQASLTPFVGVGYVWEKNAFVSPSPLTLHFKTRFPYFSTGCLFWMHLQENWELGFNVKLRYPWEPRAVVTHDPENDSLTQNVRARLHARLELPITYRIVYGGEIALALIPFYETRNYGTHPNYPFSYQKTRLRFWGAALEFIYRL